MKPTAIYISDFFTYRDTLVTLPEQGVLLVTGDNGAGKSALGEAISWCLWGETIRDSDPVPNGRVAVTAAPAGYPAFQVIRDRKGRKLEALTLLDTSVTTDNCDLTGQTPTETQEKINQRFGDWRRFSATRVFSRQLLSRFGAATNKERQTLLEGIFGWEQFNRAEKVARGVLSSRRAAESEASSVLRESMAALTRSREAGEAQPEGRDPGAIQAEIDALAKAGAASYDAWKVAKAKLEKAQGLWRQTFDAMNDRRREAAQLGHKVDELRGRISGVSKLNDCPVCLRAVEKTDQAAIVKHYAAEMAPLRKQVDTMKGEADLLEADAADQKEFIQEMGTALGACEADVEAFEEQKHALAAELAVAKERAARATTTGNMVARDEKAVEDAGEAFLRAQLQVKIATAAVEALGAKGARVRLFEDALARLENETNVVLTQLGIAMSVTLSAKKTQATGKEVSEVSMKVSGAGGGEYSGTSGGERTRVDVALLLALARLANTEGFLWFDEIFDTLDVDGLERVAEMLQDLGRDRLVMITSHHPRLQEMLPQANSWRIEKTDGQSRIAS